MGKHSAPRTRTPFWSILGAGAVAAALVTGTVAPAALASTDPYGAGNGAVCGTDAECAQWSLDHDQAMGYGADQTELAAQERRAAGLIADRMIAGGWTWEDWTWTTAPPVVGQFNDTLQAQWAAAGRPDAAGWLDSYAAQS